MNCCLLDELFDINAGNNPDITAILVEDGSRSLSFNELKERTNRLSAAITGIIGGGSFPESPMISIMIDRDVGMIVAILSVLKCGCAYVPVDPAFPPDRQSHIFSHSRSKCLIIDSNSYENAKRLGVDFPLIIMIDSQTGMITKLPEGYTEIKSNRSIAPAKRRGSDIAYVLYTSGSTGKPKGVMVTHEGVANIISWFANELKIKKGNRVLGLTTFCFDISVLEMFIPLLFGATLVIATSAAQKDPFLLLDIFDRHHIDIFQATPTTYEMLLAAGWNGDKNMDLLVGGEAFRPSLLPLVKNSKSLRNVYGPTETTIWSSSYNFHGEITSQSNAGNIIIPIGTPISKTEFYLGLLSESGELTGQQAIMGEEGELCIGGIGVAKGYLHAPELTVQRFVPNLFLPGKKRGEQEWTRSSTSHNDENTNTGYIYRTGDLVKQLPDGNYVFVRRLDDQVKVNGYRIELAEVEFALSSYPPVEQAVVIVRHSALAAYIKLKPKDTSNNHHNEFDVKKMIEFAGRSLTKYMLPTFVVIMETFPQTANGKLDRKALPDPPDSAIVTGETVGTDTDLVDDTTTTEQGLCNTSIAVGKSVADHVCDIIESVRGQRPKVTASFASMGVDSLGAVLFLRVLSDSLGGIRITPASVYGAGINIASFSDTLRERMLNEKPEVLQSLGIDGHLPSSSASASASATRKPMINEGEGGGGVGREWHKVEDLEKGMLDKVEDTDDEDVFGEMILKNKDALEGIRGMLMLLVLWDHFIGRSSILRSSPVLLADTTFFIIASGFTTALQLRAGRDAANKAWDWGKFIVTRAVGLFPVLWLSLIVNAPRWRGRDVWASSFSKRRFSTGDEATCVVLYVIGEQGWVRPMCHYLGPNDVLYASLIWNCFLMYAIFRVFFDKFQRMVYSFCLPEIANADNPTKSTSLSCRLAHLFYTIGINRPTGNLCILLVIIWTGFYLALFRACLEIAMKTPISYIVYFFSGVTAASVAESIHWATVGSKRVHGSVTTTTTATIISFRQYPTYLIAIRDVLSAISPDILVLLVGIMISNLGKEHRTVDINMNMRNIWAPFCIVLLLIIILIQPTRGRYGIIRLFVELPFIRVIGYASYPIYVLQQVILNFYFRMFVDKVGYNIDFTSNLYAEIYYKNEWFGAQAWWYKPIGLALVTIIGYVVQKYFQDVFIAGLWSKFMMKTKISNSKQ